jgi:thymidine kinase
MLNEKCISADVHSTFNIQHSTFLVYPSPNHTHPEATPLDGYKGGWIEIIAGGMFSGKSEELIRRLRRSVIARQRVQVFKPFIDDRFSTEDIVSRDDRRLKAMAVVTSAELLARVEIGVQVVGIDEVQFFDPGVVEVCMQLADAGIRVIAAGLDQDYMRRPFGPMPALLAVAEEVSKMHAVCVRCRGAAHYSQRVSGGDAQVEVGDSSYEARCRSCFESYKAVPQDEPEIQLTMPQSVGSA